MSGLKIYLSAAVGFAWVIGAFPCAVSASDHWQEARIPGTSEDAMIDVFLLPAFSQ